MQALAATRFTDVRVLPEADSTNQRVLELAREGVPEGVVIAADHQTAGRGRRGRTWSAPPGTSLLVSVLVRPPIAVSLAHLVTSAAAVAAAEACQAVAGIEPSLKWPNDLVVEDASGTRKLAGLLAESVVEAGLLEAVVVGMGMNVNWPSPLPTDLADSAVAVNGLVGHDVDRTALLVSWLTGFDRLLEALDLVAVRYRERCSTIGRQVRVELADGAVEGLAVDVTQEGHLLLETDTGPRELTVGDVVHLRPLG